MKNIIVLWLLAASVFATDYVGLHLDANNDPTPFLAGEALKLPTASGGFTVTLGPGAQTASYSATLPVMPSSSIFAMSAAALTSGRVPYATTNGLLIDDDAHKAASTSWTLGNGTSASAFTMIVDALAGQSAQFNFRKGGLNRWIQQCDSTAESGANAGSDWGLLARSDAGTAIDAPISIARAAGGNITLVRPLTTSGNLTQTGATTLSTGTGAVSLNGVTTCKSTDALTNSRAIVGTFNHVSTGTPAASFGTEVRWLASSDTTAARIQGTIYGIWVVATDATRTSRFIFNAADSASTRECMRMESSGTAGMIGFLGASAVVRPASTDDLRTALINLGLYTTGGASPLNLNGGALTASSGTFTAAITSSGPTSGIGYGTGAGGAVTQITSRVTGVTLDKVCGDITLVSAAGSAAYQSFTVTNSTVAATDTIQVNQKSGTDKNIILVTALAAGSFQITFATTGGTTVEQPVFTFTVIKGANN